MRLQQLEERLKAAEQQREQSLHAVRARAATSSARREGVISKRQERQEALSSRLTAELQAAEERRLALRDAERERLKAEHQLVFARLAMSRSEDGTREEQRKRMESRLQAAEEARAAKLAEAAARAGQQVKKAVAVSQLTKMLQQQEVEQLRDELDQKLQVAEERRSAVRQRRRASGHSRRATHDAMTAAGCAPGAPASASPRSSTFSASLGRLVLDDPASAEPQAVAAVASPDLADLDAATTSPEVDAATADLSALMQQDEAEAAAEEEAASRRLEVLRRQVSSRKLQQCWRAFCRRGKTTHALVTTFVQCGITGVSLPLAAGDAAQGEGDSSTMPTGNAAADAAPPTSASGPVFIGHISPGTSPRAMDDFERFAMKMKSADTIRAAQALLRRLEVRLHAKGMASMAATRLLRCIFPPVPTSPGKKSPAKVGAAGGAPSTPPRAGNESAAGGAAAGNGTPGSSSKANGGSERAPERYPPRVFLCAYMILTHPRVVFNTMGEREARLTAAAKEMVAAFEELLARVLQPPPGLTSSEEGTSPKQSEGPAGGVDSNAAGGSGRGSRGGSRADAAPSFLASSPTAQGMRSYRASRGGALPLSPGSSRYTTIGQQLVSFDEAWLRYLDQFAAWKGEDAASLEAELVHMAVELEKSKLRKCGSQRRGSRPRAAEDLAALVEQVAHDHELLRERINGLSGEAGLHRLEEALAAAQAAVALELSTESGTESTSASDTDRCASASATPNQLRSPAASFVAAGAGRGVVTEPSTAPGTNGAAEAAGVAVNTAAQASITSPTGAAPPSQAAAVSASPSKPAPMLRRGFFGPSPTATPRTTVEDATPAPAPASASTAAPASSPLTQPIPIPSGASTRPGAGGMPSPGTTSAAMMMTAMSPHSPSSTMLQGHGGMMGMMAGAPSGGMAAMMPPEQLQRALSNLNMVYEIVHNPSHQLKTDEADAMWQRAIKAIPQPRSLGVPTSSPAASGPTSPSSKAQAPASASLGMEHSLDRDEVESMSPAEVVALMMARSRAIAERAFWDSVEMRLAAGLAAGSLVDQVLPLLSELGTELSSVVSEPQLAASLRREWAEDTLRGALQGVTSSERGASLQALMGLLGKLAQRLLEFGAPAREEEAQAATVKMRTALEEALVLTLSGAVTTVPMDTDAATAPGKASVPNSAGPSSSIASPRSDTEQEQQQQPQVLFRPPTAAQRQPLAAALASALRLLTAQQKLLKLDAANFRLQALARSLSQGPGAVAYLRSKFREVVGLRTSRAATASPGVSDSEQEPVEAELPPPMQLAMHLPRTAGFLQQAALGSLPAMERFMVTAGVAGHLPRDEEAAEQLQQQLAAALEAQQQAGIGAGALPAQLRSGLRAVGGSKPSAAHPGQQQATASSASSSSTGVQLVAPVCLRSWRGMLRVGVVGLVAQEVPAVGPSLAETLRLDQERLHAAQNRFQQLVIVTAGLLLVSQIRARVRAPAWTPAERSAARRRLLIVVADPKLSMADLTAELCQLAGALGDQAASEQLATAFSTITRPGSGALASIGNGVAGVLLAHLLLGTSGSAADGGAANDMLAAAKAAMTAVLNRIGASVVAEDVAALAADLAALVAVNEAVHGDLYERLAQPLMEPMQAAIEAAAAAALQAAAPAPVTAAAPAAAVALSAAAPEDASAE